MPASYTNFFENKKEADMRLVHTVVLYDDEPYYVLCICDHKQDGIYRIYLDRLGDPNGLAISRLHPGIPYEWPEGHEGKSRGEKMDEFLEKNPNSGIIRKMMNSPKFNKFRPFQLGMLNRDGDVYYTERQPTRHTQQGLTQQMVTHSMITLQGADKKGYYPGTIDYTSVPFYDTIKGSYPEVTECLARLKNPQNANTGIAFDRQFAFLKGPLNLIFLAYKTDVIGLLPAGDTSRVEIGSEFRHTKEVVENLKLFDDIRVI